jgi:DNA-binding NtrC family response regulator
MQRLALFVEREVRPADLPSEIGGSAHVERLVRACGRCIVDGQMSYTDVVACLETNLLRQALADAGGNQSHAARALGLSLSTLRDKLHRFGLDNRQD